MFLLAVIRYIPVVAIPPLSPMRWAPPLIRIVVVLSLAWLTVLASSPAAIPADLSGPVAWTIAALSELAIGTAFGAAVAFPMAAVHTAGWVIDVQAGLGSATLFDPGSQGDAQSPLGAALLLLATTLFFTMDLHLDLYAGLVVSAEVLPFAGSSVYLDASAFLSMVGSSFLLGLMVAAPTVLCLFAIDVGVAYATRSMPQANVYFLALPLKVFVAMILTASSLGAMPAAFARLFRDATSRVPSVLGM
ncbi:flagellar biosynthetic protein FliR [Arenimonas terrae]|nr:flagellar biosynthetic protein FliR [Arenimonas terrae]